MAFDLKHAIRDTLAGGSPLVERLMSYLHFADATVLTRASWDDWGSGLTLVGLRGSGNSGEVVVLAGAMPGEGFGTGGTGIPEPEDAGRAVALLAQCWALSSIAEPGDRAVALIGYRPDPLGASLSDALWSLGLEPAGMLVAGNGTGGSRKASNGLAVVSVSVPAVGRDAQGQCPDVASLTWGRPDGSLGPDGTEFKELARWLGSWNGRCLGISRAAGLDTVGPSLLTVCVGGTAVPVDGPLYWHLDRSPGIVPIGGVPLDAAGMVGILMDTLGEFSSDLWPDFGVGTPGWGPHVLGIRPGSVMDLLVAVPLPGMKRSRAVALEEALRKVLDRIEAREPGSRATVRAFHWGDGSAVGLAAGSDGAAATLAGRFPDILIGGPDRESVRCDPGGAAEKFARECLTFLARVTGGSA